MINFPGVLPSKTGKDPLTQFADFKERTILPFGLQAVGGVGVLQVKLLKISQGS